MGMNKARLLVMLTEALRQELHHLRAAAEAALQGATHEDAKPENEYDTRALEQSYLAGAQAARVDNLSAAISSLDSFHMPDLNDDDPIVLGAAVVVEDEEGAPRRYFLCEVGGGAKLDLDGHRWWVLTPSSPLGKKLIGRRCGDVVEHVVRGDGVELEIVEVG